MNNNKRIFGNIDSFMDYLDVHYALFNETNAKSVRELTDNVLITPTGFFPIHFFTPNDAMLSMPFVVHSAGFFRLGDKYYTKRDSLENYEFIYTTDGNGIIKIEDEVYNCTRGSAVLLDCRKYHYLYTKPGSTWCYKHFHFTAAESTLPLISKALAFVPKLEIADKYVDMIVDQLLYNHVDAPYLINKYLVELLTDMVTSDHTASDEDKITNKMNQVAHYIQDNLDKNMTIEELSSLAFLSPFYFSRQFKAHFDASPHQYILQCRINKAKILLLQNKDTDYIVENCGFGTPSNFYRRFKTIVGMTPSKYIKNNL